MKNQTQKKSSQNKVSQTKQTILITGATAGIGQATALLAAQKNYQLILIARRKNRLENLAASCLKQGASSVELYQVDLQKKSEVLSFCKKMKSKKIDILINNAGLAQGVDVFQNSKLEDADTMFDTNVKGLLYITRGIISQLVQAAGHIINIGSVAGRLVYEGGAVYCATKFAVRALSEGLRMDLKGTGVRVTNIEPGMVNTEFSRVRLGNQQKADAVYADMMPLLANDIAETILWCVERPQHVNIQELVIYPTDQASVGQVVRGEKSILNLKRA